MLITLEPLPPPLRKRIEQEGLFEVIEPQEVMPEPTPRGYFSTPEEPTIFYLEAEALEPTNLLITDFLMLILI